MKQIPKPVWLLGLVSFFNDVASDMIYPIVPIFLTSVLKVTVPVVGIIEGIAEATASISKYGFGAFSDYLQKRKAFVIIGYAFSAVSKLFLAVAYAWPFVLLARFTDRIGKGIRTAARDSLLLENTTPANKGFIFGFHRAFDSAGAVGGSLLGLLLLYLLHENMRLIFLIALLPTVVAVFLLFLIKEKKSAVKTGEKKYVKIVWKNIDPQMKIFAISSLIFALGNSADAFLILRAKDLGLSTTFAVFAYVLYNVFQTIFATPGGSLADKIGAKRVYIYGLMIFAVVYFAFGIIHNPIWLWLIFPLYGIYISFTDGVSKSYIGGFIKKEESGSYFGAYYTLIGVANFFASFIGGWLWTQVNPSATLYFGSIMAVAGLLIFLVSKKSAVRS